MYKTPSDSRQASLFWDLETMLDPNHPLFKLANMIDRRGFEKAFSPLYCADNGRPPKPIRLMVGLLILKHLRDVSDEQVVAQFSENAYYQYFCGQESFSTSAPCASTELVHFRHRIGEDGIELILKESIRVNLAVEDGKREEEDARRGRDGRGRKSDKAQTAFIDTTVQEKNVTFPTDSKLLNKIIGHCKSDHHLGRNFYKGLFGDSINVMLAAAAFNFKRIMNLLLCLFSTWLNSTLRLLTNAMISLWNFYGSEKQTCESKKLAF